MDSLSTLKTLLTQGKEYKALSGLVEFLKHHEDRGEFLNTIFLLQSRLEATEGKFNQGIITFEEWSLTRNRIVYSNLKLVEKIETHFSQNASKKEEELVANEINTPSKPSFILQLANPTLARNLTFYFVALWLLLGALDTLFFRVATQDLVETKQFFAISFSKYVLPEDGNVIPWLRDFIGHWFAFGTLFLAIVLEVIAGNLERTAQSVLQQAHQLYTKFFPFITLLALGLIVAIIYSNINYVSENSTVTLWSAKISTPFLPAFIATNYFLIVAIPLLLAIFHYCLLLHVSIKEFKSFSTYNPFHGDQNFGLLKVGKSIFWGTMAGISFLLIAFLLQLEMKGGELTFNTFLSSILFIGMFWFGAVNPLRKLSKKLGLEKEQLYESIKEEVRDNNRMLSNQSTVEDLNAAKLLLEAAKENEKRLLSLKTVPVSAMELIAGVLIFVGLLAKIVHSISRLS